LGGEYAVFILDSFQRNQVSGQKKGREPVAPLTEGTAKRPMQEDAPSRARFGRWLSAALAFGNSRFLGKAAAVLR
jgi:hypothetical protein